LLICGFFAGGFMDGLCDICIIGIIYSKNLCHLGITKFLKNFGNYGNIWRLYLRAGHDYLQAGNGAEMKGLTPALSKGASEVE